MTETVAPTWMRRARLGVLDIAALVCLAVLCGYFATQLFKPSNVATVLPMGKDGTQDKKGGNDKAVAGPDDKNKPAPQPTRHGAFGLRDDAGRAAAVKFYGGSKETEASVNAGLRWLAYHQEPDGHWDSMKYGTARKHDTELTALSALAFLGAGHCEARGEYKDNIKRAIAWLKSKQNKDGRVFDTTDHGGEKDCVRPHAVASMALGEAAGMHNIESTRAAAQRSIDYLDKVRSEGNGWGDAAGDKPNLPTTAWVVMALKANKVAGIKVPHVNFDAAIALLDGVETRLKINDQPFVEYRHAPGEKWDAPYPPTYTPMGALCRQWLGWKIEDVELTVSSFVSRHGMPWWIEPGSRVKTANSLVENDFAYWHIGTLAAFQQGGRYWNDWNAALIRTLTENQCKQGDDSGSWPIAGANSEKWGRVGHTALGTLCLETYYRYKTLRPDSEVKVEPPVELTAAEREQQEERRKQQAAESSKATLKDKVTFNFTDDNLDDVVKVLSRLTTLKVVATDALRSRKNFNVSLRVTDMQFGLAVEWICRLIGAEQRLEGNTVILDVPGGAGAAQAPDANDPNAAFQSSVLAVRTEIGLCMLSGGDEQNVLPGAQYKITRNGKFIATVKVDKVYPDMVSAKILGSIATGEEIQVHDKATLETPGKKKDDGKAVPPPTPPEKEGF